MRFRNYINKHTNENKIYSKENIQNMTVKDAFSRKQELLAQNRSIGIPTEDELNNSSNVVWNNPYVKDDGTKVLGHWRSKAEGGFGGYSENEQNSSNDDMTGGASKIDRGKRFFQRRKGDVNASLEGNVSNTLNVEEPDYFAENIGDYNGDLDELDYPIASDANSKLLTGGVKMDDYIDSAPTTTQAEAAQRGMFQGGTPQAETTHAENDLSKSIPAVKPTAPVKPNNSNAGSGIPTFDDTNVSDKLYYLNKVANQFAQQGMQKVKDVPKNIAKQFVQQGLQKLINEDPEKWEDKQGKAAVISPFPFTPAQYYGHSIRLAEGKEPTDFMKKNNIFTKLSDLPDNELKSYYINKVEHAVPDYYKKHNDIQMVVAKKDSQLHNDVKTSAALQEFVAENYDNANGRMVKKSIEFPPSSDVRTADFALHTTVHKADVTYAKKYPDGSMLVVLSDVYDFEHWNVSDDDIIGNINNVADSQQKQGKLHPYLLTIPIFLSKDEVDAMRK